jgi:hypothetical protein
MVHPIHRHLMMSAYLNLRNPLFFSRLAKAVENCKESARDETNNMANYQSVGYNFMLCSIFQHGYPSNPHDWLCCSCTFRPRIPWHFYIIKCLLLHTLLYSGPKKLVLFFIHKKIFRGGGRKERSTLSTSESERSFWDVRSAKFLLVILVH